jgi:Cu(I)/Ag(I) efflux system protein CusF
MKELLVALVLSGVLMAASAMVAARQMDSTARDTAGMHDARPTDAHGMGVIRAIDPTQGTITLQHEAIAAIGWPSMTMPFRLASPDLLKHVKVGDKVRFTLRPAGKASTVTSIAVRS